MSRGTTYDVDRLLASEIGRMASGETEMAKDCVRHARMFFNRPHLDLASAIPGSFALTPHDGMLADLRRGYPLQRASPTLSLARLRRQPPMRGRRLPSEKHIMSCNRADL